MVDETKLDEMVKEMISAADVYCSREDIKRTTLGRFIMNDGEFFENLVAANNCTIKTYRKVIGWLRARGACPQPARKNIKSERHKKLSLVKV